MRVDRQRFLQSSVGVAASLVVFNACAGGNSSKSAMTTGPGSTGSTTTGAKPGGRFDTEDGTRFLSDHERVFVSCPNMARHIDRDRVRCAQLEGALAGIRDVVLLFRLEHLRQS